MHTRRLATFLLGGWVACSLFMAAITVGHLRSVELTFQSELPEAVKQITQSASRESVQALVQYHSSELHRSYLRNWERAQLVLGVLFVTALLFATHTRRLPLFFGGLMVVLVGFLHFFISPEIIYIGRQLDFASRDSSVDLRMRLWMLNQIYVLMDLVKVLIGFGLAAYLFYFRSRRTQRSRPVDLEDTVTLTERKLAN